MVTASGLSFIRKKTADGTLYFIANQNNLFEKGTVRLSVATKSVRLFDPLHEQTTWLSFKKTGENDIEVPLNLPSGESVFIEILPPTPRREALPSVTHRNAKVIDNQRLTEQKHPTADNARQSPPSGGWGEKILRGRWQVNFIKGEPSLPTPFQTDSLASWTVLSADTMAQYFSGTARYTTTFDLNLKQIGKSGWLELGDVRESATVRLNGKMLGTAWSLPFRVPITVDEGNPDGIGKGLLLPKGNKLEIDVTNLSANRIRYLDKKHVNWRKFYDINFVDISYRPFDAADWLPVPSGLLGTVKIKFD